MSQVIQSWLFLLKVAQQLSHGDTIFVLFCQNYVKKSVNVWVKYVLKHPHLQLSINISSKMLNILLHVSIIFISFSQNCV